MDQESFSLSWWDLGYGRENELRRGDFSLCLLSHPNNESD